MEQLEQTKRTGALVPGRGKLSGILLSELCQIQRAAGKGMSKSRCICLPGWLYQLQPSRELWMRKVLSRIRGKDGITRCLS